MSSLKPDDNVCICPYNSAHRVSRKRFQPHLMKCKLEHPHVELKKCPFNQLHLLTEANFERHITICPNRKIIDENYDNDNDADVVTLIKHNPIDCEENWDDVDEVPEFKLIDGKCKKRKKRCTEVIRNRVDLSKDVKETSPIFKRRSKEEPTLYRRRYDDYSHYVKVTVKPMLYSRRYSCRERLSHILYRSMYAHSKRNWPNFYSLDDDPYYNGSA